YDCSYFHYAKSMKITNKVITIISLILLIIILVTVIFYYSGFLEGPGSYIISNLRALNELVKDLTTEFDRIFNVSDAFTSDLLKSSLSLFVVINPIGSIALFISMTAKMDASERKVVSKNIMITAAALLIAFGTAGTQLLSLFGIEIFSFMIAGGILLFIISIELLTRGMWRYGDFTSTDIGVVPLAFPLLTGPGAITSVIISLQSYGLSVTLLSIALALLATYAILRSEDKIFRVLGRRGLIVITRVLAIFLASIAIQYVIEGSRQILFL
ncbi:MAG: MarC family protein, partial [Nitrososphaeraceae archaeon]